MDALINEYYNLSDKGISVVDMYIYHILSSDDRTFDLDNTELSQIIDRVKEMRYTYNNLAIEDAIDRVLEGEDAAWDLY